MNKPLVFLMLGVILLAGVVEGQSEEESMAEAVANFDASMEAIAEFVRGVEFGEDDIQNVLTYWPEMAELDVMESDDEDDSGGALAQDIQKILADPQYLEWAKGRGLDPEGWLRKSVRVTTVMMTQQLEEQKEMIAAQRQSYAKMVEESCAQVDEAACQQMRDAMTQSMAIGESMMKAAAKLPPATAGELALLEQYGPQLQALMMADEGYDEYGSEYGDEYDEEYDEDGG